jgi:hypothetical protein
MAAYDHELPATATQNLIATHLGDFDVPTSRKAHKLGDLLTRNGDAVTAFNTANTDFIRLNDERNLAQAVSDAANLAFDTVTTTWTTTRLERDNARIALEPAQARYELDRKHTLEHIVLKLQRAGARDWVHLLGNSSLELFTLALQFLKDFLRHPDPCARVVRAHRIDIASGDHRVGPTFTKLALHEIILCAGNGANLVSGLHPQCIQHLAIKPRLLANVGVNSNDSVESDDSASSDSESSHGLNTDDDTSQSDDDSHSVGSA